MDQQVFRPILILLIAIAAYSGHAQGWLKVYDFPGGNNGKVEEIPGGYRIAGQNEMLVDQDGDFVQANPVQPPAMPGLQLSDGNYLAGGTTQNPAPDFESDVTLVKKTPDGDTVWAMIYPRLKPQGPPHTVLELPNGELMAIGLHTFFAAGINSSYYLYALKTDALGNLISFN